MRYLLAALLFFSLPAQAQVFGGPVIGGGSGGGGGVTSISGDGVLFSNSASTGVVTLTKSTAAAQTVYGNATGSTAAPTFTGAPVLSTSLTSPLVIGGTGAASTLTLESTSGAGIGSDSVIIKAGGQVTIGTFSYASNAVPTFAMPSTAPSAINFGTATVIGYVNSAANYYGNGVAGDIAIRGLSGKSVLIGATQGSTLSTLNVNAGGIAVTGTVGVGTTTIRNSALVDINGGLNVSGSGVFLTGLTTGTNADFLCYAASGQVLIQATACTISQRKLKENIVEISDQVATHNVMGLIPVQFNMIQANPSNSDNNFALTQHGFIAEDVASVDKHLAVFEPDGKTPKTYRQESLISDLTKVVQSHQKRLDDAQYTPRECYGLSFGKTCVGYAH